MGSASSVATAAINSLAEMGATILEGTNTVAFGPFATSIYGDACFIYSGSVTGSIFGSTSPGLLTRCTIFGNNIDIQDKTYGSQFTGEDLANEDIPAAAAGTQVDYVDVKGRNASAYIPGTQVYATGQRASIGDAQRHRCMMQAYSTTATAATYYLQILKYGTTQYELVLKNLRTYSVTLQMTARDVDTPYDSAMFEGNALVRVDNSGVAVLVGSTMVMRHGDAAATWSSQFVVSGRTLRVEVIGAASTNILWNADVTLVEAG